MKKPFNHPTLIAKRLKVETNEFKGCISALKQAKEIIEKEGLK